MAETDLTARFAALEEKIRLLTIENDDLAERAEEALLFSLIAEKVHASGSVDELINVALEQVAVLKNIPYVACFALVGSNAELRQIYAVAPDEAAVSGDLVLPPPLIAALEDQGCTLTGGGPIQFPAFDDPGAGFRPATTILLPLHNQIGEKMFLVVAADGDDAALGGMRFLLPRLAELIATRIDNIELFDQAALLNEHLDRVVLERTRELRASESRLRTLFEGAVDAIFVIDAEMTIIAANREACEKLGYSRDEILGMKTWQIPADIGAEDMARIFAEAESGDIQTIEVRHRRKDGSTFPVEVRLGMVDIDGEHMFMAQARDLSERNRLVEQLNQAQKMEAVGRLAGGIAHDFNNVLTAIMGQVDLIKIDLPADHPTREDLDLILETSERATGLTRQLLAFSRKQVMDMGHCDLAQTIAASSRMLLRMVDETVELQIDVKDGSGYVYGDPIRVEQILMNLVINARDAMPNGGIIHVSIKRAPAEADYLPPLLEGPPATGQYLVVRVSDSGHGIPEEIRSYIFDPFFTTKSSGKGTGLGLSMVYGLAQQHQALVRVQSEVGVGSTFEVIFPEVDAPAERTDEPDGLSVPLGDETILLVEDDAAIRKVMARMIKRLGYALLEAVNGADALDVLAAHGDTIDLVLTDVIMPRMSGGDLVRQLKRRFPGLKVIYMSGYTDEAVSRADLGAAGTRFLQKPIPYLQLAQELRSALDEKLSSESGD